MKSSASIKRLLLQAGLLLFLNVVVMLCGAAVDIFWNWMDNPLAAAFPALLAFLFSFWQPWIWLWLIPSDMNYMILVAPTLSAPVTLTVYKTLFRLGKLNGLYYLWLRFPPRQKAVAIVSFLILGTLSSYAGYKDVPVQHRGIPKFAGGNDARFIAKYALSDSRYYTQDRFLVSNYLWRVHIPQKNVAPLMKHLNLTRIPQKGLPADFWQQQPIWWQRPSANTWEAYADHTAAASPYGRFLAYDPQTQTLYYWWRFNQC